MIPSDNFISSRQILDENTIHQLRDNNSKGHLTKEQWLELVKIPRSLKNNAGYSFTIELYESMPKYVDYQKSEGLDTFQTRPFMYRGVELSLLIQSAVVPDEKGVLTRRYPGPSEEIIEEVLRKMAVDGALQDGNINNNSVIGVKFTLYQLRKELAAIGHTRSFHRIKQSLDILAQASMTVTGVHEGKKLKITSAILNTLMTSSKIEDKDEGLTKCYAAFHPLVYHSFLCGTHRLVNYDKCVRYKVNTAKRIHKRLSHNFLQAASAIPYKISMNTLLNDFGMKLYKYPKITFDRKLKGALDELVKVNTILRYEVLECPMDYILCLYPSEDFVREVKTANFWYSVEQKLRSKFTQELPDFPNSE